MINGQIWSEDQIDEVLRMISPLENDYEGILAEHFARDNAIPIGGIGSTFSHNGLYQELGYLYAAKGDLEKTLQCIDTLLLYNKGYFANDYNFLRDNATNIAYYFLSYGHEDLFSRFVDGYTSKSSISRIDFLDKISGRTILSLLNNEKGIGFNARYMHNTNLGMMSKDMREKIFGYYEQEIRKIENSDAQNFRLALLYKHKALFDAQQATLSSGSYDAVALRPLYQKAMDHFEKVSQDYLSANTDRMFWGARKIQDKRKTLFISPGFQDYQTIWSPREYPVFYFNTSFIDFLTDGGYLAKMYQDENDFDMINEWSSKLSFYQGLALLRSFDAFVDFASIHQFLMALKTNPAYKKNMLTSLKIITSGKLFDAGKEEEAMDIAREIAFDAIPASLPDIQTPLTNQKMYHVGQLAFHLLKRDETTMVDGILNAFERPANKAILLARLAEYLGYEGDIEQAKKYLELAKEQEAKKEVEFGASTYKIITALMALPNLEGYEEARSLWKNFPFKQGVDNLVAFNISSNGDAWKPYEDIEKLLPSNTRIFRFARIGAGIREFKGKKESEDWKVYDQTNNWFWNPLFFSNN